MTRKKVKLAYISNDSARKATFKKRKKGLVKKVGELSTLCDVDACAIIYSPYDTQPELFPSPLGVQRVLSKFKKMPEMEQSKKMVNQESFLRQRIAKANEQLKKQRKDNREKEMTRVMFQSLTGKGLQGLNMMDLNDLGWLIDQNLKDINKRIESHKAEASSQKHDVAAPGMSSAADGMARSGENGSQAMAEKPAFEVNVETMQRQQWFMDLMNPQEGLGFGGDEMILPFGDHNHNAIWSNPFFP
ncbi:agamous-like MADS-box protein AGL80 [Ziziphus jujuba]|uniref:Agamous-like MADS-box protein AGL80 n=2 Tax=Ziziphus jujuba TaxID=326968 RepID=A0A6P3Z9Q9_ZIZJJ|nr:agamous-like MADS-box protein AGL80 [Ziziphus jujuba]KAH7542883.1 hypothetical protein FEM48_Zijuj02G0122400 [Ziziphus jujuba var. spinosa]